MTQKKKDIQAPKRKKKHPKEKLRKNSINNQTCSTHTQQLKENTSILSTQIKPEKKNSKGCINFEQSKLKKKEFSIQNTKTSEQ